MRCPPREREGAIDSVRVYLDFVDPMSYVLHRRIHRILEDAQARGGTVPEVVLLPFELRVPPQPLIAPDEPPWLERWAMAREMEDAFLPDQRPRLIPWTRKAHELCAHARERKAHDRVHSALFDAHLTRGMDIGRVDVLVGIAHEAGLDPSESKAVLDVDRFAERIWSVRRSALEIGVTEPATLVGREGRLTRPPVTDRDLARALESGP